MRENPLYNQKRYVISLRHPDAGKNSELAGFYQDKDETDTLEEAKELASFMANKQKRSVIVCDRINCPTIIFRADFVDSQVKETEGSTKPMLEEKGKKAGTKSRRSSIKRK